MQIRTPVGLLGLVVAAALTGCDRRAAPQTIVGPSPTTAPQPIPTPTAPRLIAFIDSDTGVTTSEVRDAQDHVVQFS